MTNISAEHKPLSAAEMYEYVSFLEDSAADQHDGIRDDFEMNFGKPLLGMFDQVASLRRIATQAEQLATALIDSVDAIDEPTMRRLGFKLIDGGTNEHPTV